MAAAIVCFWVVSQLLDTLSCDLIVQMYETRLEILYVMPELLLHICNKQACILIIGYLICLLYVFYFQFIFRRDLKHCPAFSKLKTLVLNEYWCNAPDLDPLACILKNSPVLEKLYLELFSTV